MNFGKAFTFAFDDPEWLKKVAINALIGLIPLIGQIYLLGWGLEVARRVATMGSALLPEVDFSTYLGHGFKAFVIALVYAIPMWIIMIPMVLVSAVVGNANMDESTMMVILGGSNLIFGLLAFVYGLFMGIILPAAMTRAVVFGTIKDGLQFSEVFGIVKAAPGAFLLTLVGTMAAGMLAALVGGIACGVGVIFTAALQQVVTGHFYGQAYLQGTARA